MYAGLLVKVYDDSGVCLSRAWTKTTMNAFGGTFTSILHSSRGICCWMIRIHICEFIHTNSYVNGQLHTSSYLWIGTPPIYQDGLASLWRIKLTGRGSSVPMTADWARRFSESLVSQTGRKRVVSTNDGRTSKTFWRVLGKSNWREEGSQYQWRQNKQDVLASLWQVKLAGRG